MVQTDTNDPIEIPLETEAMVTMQTPEVTPIAPTEPAEPVTPVATEPTPEPEHEPGRLKLPLVVWLISLAVKNYTAVKNIKYVQKDLMPSLHQVLFCYHIYRNRSCQ